MILRRPRSTLFPYTTLFRSRRRGYIIINDLQDHERWRTHLSEQDVRIGINIEDAVGCPDYRGGATERAPSQTHPRSEEHTSELQSRQYLVCRLLLEKKKEQK